MIEETLDIHTADGQMETFICRPERGGPFPAVFFLMDAPGIREELRDMTRRLAAVGYYVLSVGMVGVMIMAMNDVAHFWIANAMYLAFFLSAQVSTVVMLRRYRRGF